jgi:hypothetical protein
MARFNPFQHFLCGTFGRLRQYYCTDYCRRISSGSKDSRNILDRKSVV